MSVKALTLISAIMACCSIFDGTACYAGHWGDRSYELASYSPLSEKSLNDAGPLRQLISQKDFVTSILAIAKYLFFEVNKETSLETVDSIISRQLIAAGIDPYVRFDLSRIAWKDGAKDILLIPFSSPGYTVTKGVDTHIIQVALKNNGAEWDMIGMNVDLGDSFVVTIVGKDPVSAISGVPLNVRIGETDKYNSLESSLEAFKGRLLLIGGPTNAGKSTIVGGNKLRGYFPGRKIEHIDLDGYFKRHCDMPKTPEGLYDYDSPEAMKLDEAMKDIIKLLEAKPGDEVVIPIRTPDFGWSERKIKVHGDEVFVVDSIHALNSAVVDGLEKYDVMKIFIGAPEKTRLMSRIVRDAKTRDTSAFESLAYWPSIRRNELEFIESTSVNADIVINNEREPEALRSLYEEAIPLLEDALEEAVSSDNEAVRKMAEGLLSATDELGIRSDPVFKLFNAVRRTGNNRRAGLMAAGNDLLVFLGKYADKQDLPKKVDKKSTTVKMRNDLEVVLSGVKKIISVGPGGGSPEIRVPEHVRRSINILEKDMVSLEADSVISTLIGLARTAAVNEQDLVLALDMGWVPGYEQRTLIHTALNPTVKLIESLGAILRSKGVDNVKIVPKGKDEDIDSWRSRIDQLITVPNDFSNVVFLGGEETIALLEDSYSKDLVPDKKAFFAAVDPSRIKAHYDVHLEDRDWQLDLDIIKMISVALELASGINVPAASMIEKYEPQNKKVVFLPLPPEEKQDYDSLLMKYSARRAALAAA